MNDAIDKTLYVCDPNKNTECNTSACCYRNGGTCYITEHEHFAATPTSVVSVGSAYDKLVTRLMHDRMCAAQKTVYEVETKRNILADLGVLGVVE